MVITEKLAIGKTDTSVSEPNTTGYLKAFLGNNSEKFFFIILGIVALIPGVLFRFLIKSPLWLDEALTVNIAHLPVSQIPAALKRDGAPPLYYVLLHYWIDVFGLSDIAVRSLSAVFGLLTIPLVYLDGKLLWNKKAGYVAAILFTLSPFSIEYSTSTRMYSLVMFLTSIGIWAVVSCLKKPNIKNCVTLTVVTSALLYTHYWSLFLVACCGFFLVCYLLYTRSKNALIALVAVGIGSATFLFWLPTFIFQLKHTGTPWSEPPSITAVVNVVTQFAGGDTVFGRVLAMIFFLLLLFAIFGLASDKYRVLLDFKTVKRSRLLGVFFGFTLFVSVGAAVVSKTAYSSRYASILLVPLLLLVASGFLAINNVRFQLILLSLCVLLGIWGGFYNYSYMRTQAGVVAQNINRLAKPGDIVAYCPDQLGPAVNRLITAKLTQVTFPAWDNPGPKFVNWIDYAKRNESASVTQFVQRLVKAADGHSIFYVWQGGYLTFGDDCQAIASELSADPIYSVKNLVGDNPLKYYEPSTLTVFVSKSG